VWERFLSEHAKPVPILIGSCPILDQRKKRGKGKRERCGGFPSLSSSPYLVVELVELFLYSYH
jgi:hypothetical protein